MRQIKLVAEFGCFPLWEMFETEVSDNVDPNHLSITDDLKTALYVWMESYEKTLNQDYPPDSAFASAEEEEAFEAEGRRLWKELQAQLSPDFKVVYYSGRESRLLE